MVKRRGDGVLGKGVDIRVDLNRDCESKGADKGGRNVRELAMKTWIDGNREDGEQNTRVKPRSDGGPPNREKDCD